ncbi:hypothetical protein LCGC14_1924120 [marine sediment metagenome]|uniref:Uncharacterized protein n=1 Tax=marine sediment metagenome TaxID=412755 RepID=A0A0F9I3T7_9ZZZZ
MRVGLNCVNRLESITYGDQNPSATLRQHRISIVAALWRHRASLVFGRQFSRKDEMLSDRYYKDRPLGQTLISGLALPKDADGVVRGKQFLNCTFHPNCQDVTFEDCTFKECHGPTSD